MNTHNVLNGCGCHWQSPKTPFETGLARNTVTPFTVAGRQQTSHEGFLSVALFLLIGDLSNRTVQCGKTAIHRGLVTLLFKTKPLFKVLSNQDFSRVFKSVQLGVGRKSRVHTTPIVAAFYSGSFCDSLATSTNR